MKKKEIAKYDYFDIVLGRKILGIVKMADKKQKSDTIRETKYVYDTKNRLISYTDPEGRTETYTYDCNSNLTKTVDKNGNTLKNTYDNKNRLTERTAKEKKTGKETVHTYRYNAYGDVAVQDDTQFVYGDVSGQVTKETTKLTKNKDVVKNYTYDSNGNKSTFSVKAGEDTKLSLSYEYDGSSRLISVKDSEGNRAVSYAYDTEGSLSERQAANGLKTTYGYDYQNRLTSMTNETGKGVVSKYSSTYLKNGQKAEEVSTVMDKNGKSTKKTAAYTYDMLGRITKETKTGREDISYTYDANNNRKQMTIGNKTTAYQYNKNDELLRTDTLHTDTEKNDVVIYKNDKNGNQLATVNRSEIPAEAKDTSYIDVDVTLGDNQLNDNVVNHYNALNQLTETLTKNYKVSFTYDAEGLRTGKTVNGEKTIYVWDGEQVVMELSKGGAVQKRYIRGNDLVYADKGENTEKTYYVTDMHGNVVQLLDESGNVTKTYEYDSFGNEVKPEKKDENPYRYCGEYYDKETEEVYLRARYYQPSVGRFITRDTYTGESDESLSLHLYTYCENDSVNAWDPSGHYKIKMKHINGMKWKKNWKGRKWTKKNISMMNALLKKYGIKKKKSIALMMATCDQESGQGRIMQEKGDDNYCRSHGYTVYTKGAGYIQITGNDQLDFLSYIGVKPKTNRTEQISKKYAWEAACWEWGICQKGGHSMNKYVSDHGKSISVFLITQYYINGWPYSKGDKKYEQFNSDMTSLRKKTKKFSYNRKKIVVDNMKYRAPSRWSERSKSYEKAMKVFYGK